MTKKTIKKLTKKLHKLEVAKEKVVKKLNKASVKPAKKVAAKKTVKKTATKKVAAKKTVTKKAPAKKAAAKKVVRKVAAKKKTVAKKVAPVTPTTTPSSNSQFLKKVSAAAIKPIKISKKELTYEAELRLLQIELVKLQKRIISKGDRLLVILEGRDTAGKDGTIKCITQNLSPRDTHVIALGKPSDREEGEWYFQRYVAELPSAGEFVIFNRSWYNRAGVEKVMGFCTDAQYKEFMASVNDFESLLVASGIQILKYYLDIGCQYSQYHLR